MATAYRRGDGQWEFAVRKQGYPTLRRTFGTKARGDEWARKVEADMAAGTFQDVRKARSMLLKDVIERYKTEVAPKGKDHLESCRIADVLSAEFGHYGLLNLPPEKIAQYRDRLQKEGKAASTVNHHINKLSAIYTAAVKEFHFQVPLNPVRSVYRLTPPPARKQRVADKVVQWLIDANRASNAARRHKGGPEPFGEFEHFLRLAIYSAMRMGEIAKLEWPYVDFDAHTATLPDTKNNTERVVPLSMPALAILRALLAKRTPPAAGEKDRVFKLTAQGFKTAYRRAKAHVVKEHPEVARVRFHDTRREATSRMAKKLPNVIELADVTGHKKVDQLRIYYKTDPTELAKKLDQEPLI